MVLQKGFSFKNVVGKYKIENGIIYRIYGEEQETKFIMRNRTDTADERAIFLSFLSQYRENESKILDFYNQYGLLGIGEPPRYGEKLDDIFKEVEIMKQVINANEFIEKKEHLKVIDSLYKLNKCIPVWYVGVEFLTDGALVSEDIESLFKTGELTPNIKIEKNFYLYAKTAICKIIDKYVSEIKPVINVLYDSMSYEGTWEIKNLLSAMYFEIFLKLTSNKKFRKCQNSTCPNYFEIIGNDTRKIYCCRECANLEAKRNERSRKNRIKDGE